MERKVWRRPLTRVQQFEANEYVAACGDTEYGNYLFECDAPGGRLYYYRTNWWGERRQSILEAILRAVKNMKLQRKVSSPTVL